jgi:hypothetical protein
VGGLTGLALGILADILLLKKLLDRGHQLTIFFWTVVFLFYSIGIFGFFMGVPVFNALLAVPAGFIVATRLARQKQDRSTISQAARRTAWFTTGVLFFVCAASALIALISISTASDLQGMLGLGFKVTRGMILALILAGGAGLLAANWIMTLVTLRLSYRFIELKN